MNDLFLILAFVSIVGIIIGVVKPSLLRMKSRKQAFLIFGGSTVLFFILFGITSKPTENLASTSTTETSQNTPASNMPQTLEEKITKAVNDSLGDKNNMGKPRVMEVEVNPYTNTEREAYHYEANAKVVRVLVKINASENLTTNLQKGTMHDEATDLFKEVFQTSPEIAEILVWSHLPLKDQYGNTKDGLAVVYSMSRTVADKMNWSNFNHRDLPTLLNTEKKSDDRNSYFEAIKFSE